MKLYPRPPYPPTPALTQLPVDAAYAYDYLAILYVKRGYGLAVNGEIRRVEEALAEQHVHFREVLESEAFKKLREANARVFEVIEKAHRNEVSAREVQRVNLLRFEAKKALQGEFWPTTPLAEAKTAL